MITTFIARVSVLWIMILLPVLSYADMPSGDYHVFVNEPGARIWDLNGGYRETFAGFNTRFELTHDHKGKIRGFGWVYDENGQPFDDLGFTVSGSLKSIDSTVRVGLNVKLSGAVTDGFYTYDVKGKIRLDLQVADGRFLEGRAKGEVCFDAGEKECYSRDEPVQFTLFPQSGGWYLDLHSIWNLKGTATLALSSETRVPVALRLSYKASSDLTKLKLEGGKNELTIWAHAIESPHGLILHKIEGKILGQPVYLETLQ